MGNFCEDGIRVGRVCLSAENEIGRVYEMLHYDYVLPEPHMDRSTWAAARAGAPSTWMVPPTSRRVSVLVSPLLLCMRLVSETAKHKASAIAAAAAL